MKRQWRRSKHNDDGWDPRQQRWRRSNHDGDRWDPRGQWMRFDQDDDGGDPITTMMEEIQSQWWRVRSDHDNDRGVPITMTMMDENQSRRRQERSNHNDDGRHLITTTMMEEIWSRRRRWRKRSSHRLRAIYIETKEVTPRKRIMKKKESKSGSKSLLPLLSTSSLLEWKLLTQLMPSWHLLVYVIKKHDTMKCTCF